MKLLDAINNHTGRPFEIPDCSRDDLPELFKSLNFKVGAEIGVDKGEFSELFCQSGFDLYAVDLWKTYSDYDGSQERLDMLYNKVKAKLSKYKGATILRKTSMEAANEIPNNSLDFVYIDANHQLKYVIEDLVEWSKKVRSGGIISGHDYIYTAGNTPAGTCHVIPAVNAFTKAYNIRNWYLLGRRERLDNETRDRFRSFMWVNP